MTYKKTGVDYIFFRWAVCILFVFATIVTTGTINAQELPTPNVQRAVGSQSPNSVSQQQAGLRGNGMMFTENKGQITDMENHQQPDILFKGYDDLTDVYIRKTGISYILNNSSAVINEVTEQMEEFEKEHKLNPIDELKAKDDFLKKQVFKTHRIDVDFINSNPQPETISNDQVEGYTNYYYQNCSDGITHVNSFNTVLLKNIYKNVDVKYYGSKTKGLKYDILVNPGGDPEEIKLSYKGARYIRLEKGKLKIGTTLNEIVEYIPKVYQNINGRVVDVAAEYILNGTTVQFKLGNWDRGSPLIIDPFIWATYYGGSGTNATDLSSGIATDAAGNVVITGFTLSVNFPVSPGAFQASNGGATGSWDAYAVKFNPNGGRLWATYYGGSSDDQANGITTDATGNVGITGYTKSANFPTGASGGNTVAQAVYAGGGAGSYNAFVVKFDPNGARLWATYYGGSCAENSNGITTDLTGNFLITGLTCSANFPLLNPFQPVYGGGNDAFVAKFSSTGVPLWATYFGGSGADVGHKIDTDKTTGDVSISGSTTSTNFPVSGAFQPTHGGGTYDNFVVKFSATGTRLWATYYGGSGSEFYRSAIAVDASGNVIIAGNTTSTNLPTTPGVFQPAYGGAGTNGTGDFFVTKFNSNGTLAWATYLGGNKDELSVSCATDMYSNIYIMGEWEDTDNGTLPMNTCALQKTFAGGESSLGPEDWFVTKFNPNGKRICSTFIGGSGDEEMDAGGGAITTFGGYVYLTGPNAFGGFPVTAGAFQSSNNAFTIPPNIVGHSTAVVAKFCGNSCGESNPMNIDFTNAPGSVCNNVPVQFNSSVTNPLTCDTNLRSYQWTFTGGTPGSSTLQNPSGITYAAAGTYNAKLVVTSPCGKDSLTKTITINNCGCSLLVYAYLNTKVLCYGGNDGTAYATVSNGTSPYTYSWSNGTSGNTTNTTIPITGLSAMSYTITVTDGSGCSATASVPVLQPTQLVPAIFSVSDATCGISNGSVSVIVGHETPLATYNWSNGVSGSTTSFLNLNNLSPGIYTITVTDANGCTATTAGSVNATPGPTLSTSTNNSTCPAQNQGSAIATATSGTAAFTYTWSNGVSGQTTTGLAPGNYTVTVTDANDCTTTNTVTIGSPLAAEFIKGTANCTACGCKEWIMITANNGAEPYSYSWPALGVTDKRYKSKLCPGNYAIKITDKNGCNVNVTVNAP
jgi:hypothetical protein